MPAKDRQLVQATVESGSRAANAVTDFILGTWVSRCLINNSTGGLVYYRASGDASANQASTTLYDGYAPSGESTEICLGGIRSVKEVSCWLKSAGNTETLTITGLV